MKLPDIQKFQRTVNEETDRKRRDSGTGRLSLPSIEDYQMTQDARDAWMRDVQRGKLDSWFERSERIYNAGTRGQRERQQQGGYVDARGLNTYLRNELSPSQNVLRKDAEGVRALLMDEALFSDDEYDRAVKLLQEQLGAHSRLTQSVRDESAYWGQYPSEDIYNEATRPRGMNEIPTQAVLDRLAADQPARDAAMRQRLRDAGSGMTPLNRTIRELAYEQAQYGEYGGKAAYDAMQAQEAEYAAERAELTETVEALQAEIDAQEEIMRNGFQPKPSRDGIPTQEEVNAMAQAQQVMPTPTAPPTIAPTAPPTPGPSATPAPTPPPTPASDAEDLPTGTDEWYGAMQRKIGDLRAELKTAEKRLKYVNMTDAERKAQDAFDEKHPLDKFATWLGRNAKAGLSRFNSALTSTADFFLPDILTPEPVQAVLDHYREENERDAAHAARVNERMGGGGWDFAGRVGVQGTVAAIPEAILALMSGGGSTVTNLAATAGTKVGTGIARTLQGSLQTAVKNPQFWTSFAQMAGPSFDAAKEEGASDIAATATAFLNAFGGSMIEIGGGLQAIPNDPRTVATWVNGMLDEGKEEVLQGILEQTLHKYAFDPGRPVFSMDDAGAVINPARMAEEFAGGAIVGGILGGGEMALGAGVDAYGRRVALGQAIADAGAAEVVIRQGLALDGTRAARLAEGNQRTMDAGRQPGAFALGRQQIANMEGLGRAGAPGVERGFGDAAARGTPGNPVTRELMPEAESDAERSALDGQGAADAQVQTQAGAYDRSPLTRETAGAAGAESDPLRAAALEMAGDARQEDGAARLPGVTVRKNGRMPDVKTQASHVRQASATFADSGAAVTVTGIRSVTKEGSVIVTLSDGGTADVRALLFDDEATGALYAALPHYSLRGGKALLAGYDGRADVQQYLDGFRDFYQVGRIGLPIEMAQEASAYTGALPLDMQHAAYEAGVAAGAETEATTGRFAADVGDVQTDAGMVAAEDAGASDNTGVTHEDAGNQAARGTAKPAAGNAARRAPGLHRLDGKQGLNRRAEGELAALDAIARRRGIVIVVEDGITCAVLKDGQPVLQSANGYYDPRTGEIHIDINAVEGGLLFTGTHELVHFIRDWSGEQYEVLCGFVLAEVQRLDPAYDLEARIDALRARQPELTREGAIEEIVADAVTAMWTDAETVKWFVQNHRTLAEKVRDFLAEFIQDVRAAIQRIAGRGRPEMAALARDVDTLRTIALLFDDALEVAAGNFSTGIQVERGVKYSAEMEATIEAYRQAVDTELVAFVQESINAPTAQGSAKKNAFVLKPISDRAASDIAATIGVDAAGFSVKMEARMAQHIMQRHGAQGVADRSMSDINDIGRIQFVLNTYDTIHDGGYSQAYSEIKENRHNRKARTVVYEKRINGTFFVVEAVPVAQAKAAYIVSAYITKRTGGLTDAEAAPVLTPDNVAHTVPTNSIANETEKNNSEQRFSLRDDSDAPTAPFEPSAPSGAEQAAQALQREYERVRTRGAVLLGESAAQKVARTLVKEAKSAYSPDTLALEVGTLFRELSMVRGAVNWPRVWSETLALAKAVVARSGRLDTTLYDDYKDMRDYLRTTPVSLSDTQKAEVARAVDSYAAFRKRNWGRLRLREDGAALDTLWGELAERWPDMFDVGISEPDQPLALARALDAVQKVYVDAAYDMDIDAAAHDFALRLFDGYLAATEAGRVDAEAAKLRTEAKRQIAALRAKLEVDYQAKLTAYRKAMIQERTALADRMRTAQGKELERLRVRMREMIGKKSGELEAQREAFRSWKKQDQAARLEREAVGKYRTRIEKAASALNRWMQHPTDAKHVPEVLREAVRAFLLSLDFSTDRKNVYGETPRKAADWERAMQTLRAQIMDMERGDMEQLDFFADVDPDLRHTMDAFLMAAKGFGRVADMDSQQLEALAFIVESVERTVRTANALHANARYQQVEALAEASMDDMSKRKTGRGGVLHNMLNLDQLDAFAYFDELGKAGKSVLDALRAGFDKKVRHIDAAIRFIASTLKGIKTREWSGRGARLHTFELPGGTLSMTTAQVMELYVLSKRPQAMGHILGGGVRVDDTPRTVGRVIKRTIKTRQAAPVALTAADVQRITAALAPEQRRVADAMQGFMQDVAGGWGNEVSLEMYGYKKFTEPHYYPIRSDENYTMSSDPGAGGTIDRLKNLGMTKATVKGANNPLIIGDIFDTFTRHVDEMATYGGLVIPLSDAMKWYNYRSRSGEITGGMAYLGSVKQSIARVLGDKGKAYFVNLVKDINGISDAQVGTDWIGKLISNAKVAAVGANVRVVLQQPTAYLRAAAMISPAHLMKAIFMRPNVELAARYAPIALWKSLGFFDTNLGTTMRGVIVGDGTLSESVREKSLWLAGKADDVTWGALWNACALEVAEARKDLKQGTEAFFEAVGARLSEVVDRTQVVDTVFHRSQMMRSKDSLAKLYTSFMAEPTRSYNLLRSAIVEAVRAGTPEVYARLARTGITYIATAALTAAAASVVDAFRDDDTEKEWLEKYLSALFGYGEDWRDVLGSNLFSGINPLYLVPLTKEIMGLLDGYSPSRLDMDGIEALYQSANGWMKYLNGESKWSAYKLISQSVKALSKTLGIPAGSMLRTFESLYQTVAGTAIPWESETATMAGTYATMAQALRDGDAAKYGRLQERLLRGDGLDKPKTYADIDAGMRAAVLDDPRIAEAGNVRMGGDLAGYERIVKAMKAEGFKQDVVVSAINNYITEAKRKPKEKANVDADGTEALYGYDDLGTAILAGDGAGVDRVVAALKAAGKTDGGIRAAVTERVRPAYLDAVERGDSGAVARLEGLLAGKFGYDADDFSQWADPKPYEGLEAALDAGDMAAVTAEIGALLDKGKDLGDVKARVTAAFKPVYLESYYAGDTEGMKAVRQALSQIGYVEYDKTALRDWVRTDLRGRLYKAVEAGDLAAARDYSKGLQADGVTVKSLLNSLETKFKPVLAGYARAGDTARAEALVEMLVGLGLTEYRVRGWVRK